MKKSGKEDHFPDFMQPHQKVDLLSGCRCRKRCIASLCQLLIHCVDAKTVATDQFQAVDHGLGRLLFFHLLVHKPLQHVLGGIVVLLA